MSGELIIHIALFCHGGLLARLVRARSETALRYVMLSFGSFSKIMRDCHFASNPVGIAQPFLP